MINNNKFILKQLNLTNFRCFFDLRLDFHDQLTVFVAPNGGGKTAVLDAIAVALRRFVDDMENKNSSKGFDPADFRKILSPLGTMEQVQPLKFTAVGDFFGKNAQWTRERDATSTATRTTTVDMKILKKIACDIPKKNDQWLQKKRLEAPVFPLISYYGTGRLWSHMKMTQSKQTKDPTPNARKRGYTDCLSPSSHYKYFIDWFRRFSYEATQEKTDGKASPHNPLMLLSVVREAVNTALKPSGWHSFEWDFTEDNVRASHDMYGQLPVDSLSDGIRNMIGLVADIAHRAARLNPHFAESAALETPGIVLIDEVDMHLHPEWQQLVISTLREAFPLIQFIVTTHSPQVLTTVPCECIRIIEDGRAHAAPPGTEGSESWRTMKRIQGVDARPQANEATKELKEYLSLVDADQWESQRALELRKILDRRYQGEEPALLDADLLIENRKWELGR